MNREILAIEVISLADQYAGFNRAQYAGTRQFIASAMLDEMSYIMKRCDIVAGIAAPGEVRDFGVELRALNTALASDDDEAVKRAIRECYRTARLLLLSANAEVGAA